MWGFAPLLARFGRDLGFTPLVIGGCVVLYAGTLLMNSGDIGMGGFGFLSPSTTSLFVFGSSGPLPVFGLGRWWTVLTAGWLHGSILHIFFNMMSVRTTAPLVAEFYGASRMIIIYVVSGVAGFTLSSAAGYLLPAIPLIGGGHRFTVGASASIAGLIGALLYYGKRGGSSGVTEQAKSWIFGFLVMGALLPAIDNYAHLGGLAGGYLASKVLDPLYPERLDHLLYALGLLLLTAAALVLSIVTGLRML